MTCFMLDIRKLRFCLNILNINRLFKVQKLLAFLNFKQTAHTRKNFFLVYPIQEDYKKIESFMRLKHWSITMKITNKSM